MRGKYVHQAVLGILLIIGFSVCLGKESPEPADPNRYLNAVRTFADNVLKYGRDTYGPKHTPLFVDGLMVRDPNNPNYGKDGVFKPVEWIAPNGDRWVLSNLASQQNLFRTLDGLTRITGDPKYKQAAMAATKYAFENLRSLNGLFYWGGYAAYDALRDRPCGEDLHVFKGFLPYYELMWEVNPEATNHLIESLWASHILDWSNLAMNRYGPLNSLSVPKGWEHKYKGGPVFFESNGAPFATTGSDLYYAAAILSKLSGKKEPLIWAKRLAYRYVETRDPKIGMSSHIYALPTYRSKHPLADDFKGHMVHSGTLFPPAIEQILDPRVRRCKFGYFIVSPGIPCNSCPNPWICSLLVGELLGEEGKEFTQWALQELTARGNVAYRRKGNVWIPMLSDGTSLEGYTYKKDEMFGPKGTVFKPISVAPIDLWGYALAYRLTNDEFMWQMTRSIAQGNGLGDTGMTVEDRPKLQIPSDHFDPYTLLAFLELYRKTRTNAFLKGAQEVGNNILTIRFHKGFFVPSDKHIYSKLDAIEALALLHLDATIRQQGLSVPQVWPGRPLFNQPFRDKELVVDNALIYTLTETPEPPRSLQEAAACGDIEEVKSLIAQGADVNSIESLLLCTPLYHAVLKGHKDVIALLLAEGAQVDARDAFPGGTALHYAAERGYTEIVELLLARGADVNAKREYPAGDTPLHSAVRAGHKDIVELLIAHKADVNAKNEAGQTPLDLAMRQKDKEIVELLLEKGDFPLHKATQQGLLEKFKELIGKGTDINAKDSSGLTPLYYAAREGHKEIVELLVAKGAVVSTICEAAYLGDRAKVKAFLQEEIDINGKDSSGYTVLHFATRGGHRDIVELLISHGAEVNAVAGTWMTPLGVAARTGSVDVAEYLIDHGANVDGREGQWTPLQEAAYYSKEMVELLLAHGASINVGKWTALHSALDAERFDIVELLLTKGAGVNIKDGKGRTPLHIAAWYSAHDNPKIIELLLSKGADISVKDDSGKTALAYAMQGGYTEIAEILRKHGAKE